MSDTIDRQATLRAMDTWDKFGCDPDGKLVRYDDDKHYIPYVHYDDMVHAVKHMPAVEPEIIRCKDCKHWREGTVYSYCDILYGMGVLNTYDYMTAEDDFCSQAERREE